MRPLILHNVPDEELYTGDDGVQRPYAMYWPEGGDRQRNLPRTRAREVTESGSFGKSTRRSRSRTGSAPPKREDATMQNADKLFSNYVSSRQQASNATTTATASSNAAPTQRKSSFLGQTATQSQEDSASTTQASTYRKEPTEIILRGYSSPSQQYAAINHYEQLAGRICEDYSREPPIESRRYKSDLRDPALTRRQPLSSTERVKVSRVASGEHWVKITFESAEAAEAALYASPQKILGHLVYAEPYIGLPPKEDAAVLDIAGDTGMLDPFRSRGRARRPSQPRMEKAPSFPRSLSTPNVERAGKQNESPTGSQGSTQTMDTATASTATVTGIPAGLGNFPEGADQQPQNQEQGADGAYCRRIPEARRVRLLPAEQALAPQPTLQQWLLSWIPLIGWFGGSMIGNEVPRNEIGEFDFNRASLYWKLMFFLDLWFGLFSRELVSGDKDD
ncbi:uncharacterized protein F4822DRAFT_391488 [Hypoxylon trugodes]|uniref:uncharacterized protein n=1 Tax=Hypoxylon trugodes TaxID=326681 RepID=UPI0021989B10|nr:uncharacterized protein F4822DRAFT_391488 [Hypoxylon trugodes]KAI1392592.1 hypothetical protein F4822DRAFT_391488 [Hypoxylon trugodes]